MNSAEIKFTLKAHRVLLLTDEERPPTIHPFDSETSIFEPRGNFFLILKLPRTKSGMLKCNVSGPLL
jgi:hypothetical protein